MFSQSVGAVEYNDCISEQEQDFPPPKKKNECPDYITLNNLMAKFQLCWSFGKCEEPLHCHRSQVHSDPEWQLQIGSYLWVK